MEHVNPVKMVSTLKTTDACPVVLKAASDVRQEMMFRSARIACPGTQLWLKMLGSRQDMFARRTARRELWRRRDENYVQILMFIQENARSAHMDIT